MEPGKKTNIARYFKQKREESGLSQLEVAQFLGYKSAQLVSNWERGLCHPPLNKLYRLIELLSLSPKEVTDLFLEDTKKHLRDHIYKSSRKENARGF